LVGGAIDEEDVEASLDVEHFEKGDDDKEL
jgi:hypothetical protein